jgi:hypothetical protein
MTIFQSLSRIKKFSLLLDSTLGLSADRLYFHRETLLASDDRRDSCPFDRRFCRLASVACSRPLSLAAGPVEMEEIYCSALIFIIIIIIIGYWKRVYPRMIFRLVRAFDIFTFVISTRKLPWRIPRKSFTQKAEKMFP